MLISHGLRAAAEDAPVPSNPWNVSTAVFNGGLWGKFFVGTQDILPSDVFFKDDGTKMYVLGRFGVDINEYNLSTAWEISTASFLQLFSVSAQESAPQGLFFKPDGTKLYVTGSGGDSVYEYNLSTAWDVSTSSFLQSISVSSQDTAPSGVFFKPDGAKMYFVGGTGVDINEYNLSTAWDVTTASFVQRFSVSSQETNPQGVFFKPDGTKMYITGATGDDINEYNLSTAWDISTASFLQLFSVASQESIPNGLFFKSDGSKMYVSGQSSDSVWAYNLGTAWDISTASWDAPTQNYFSVVSQEIFTNGLFFKPDGTKMYIIGTSGDDVNEYNLSTAWNISTASFFQLFSVASQELTPQGVFFKPDGTKMYVIGTTGDDINEYNLSTTWDVSTASFVQLLSVVTQEGNPTNLFFKPDGLKMYVVGSTGDEVNEYNLSTAWDISTATAFQFFSVSAQETNPTGLFFKPDGTKMYIMGTSGVDVNEYDLSTAWDVSTASFLQLFSVARQEETPTSVFFKPDGTVMYVVGSASDAVWAYNL